MVQSKGGAPDLHQRKALRCAGGRQPLRQLGIYGHKPVAGRRHGVPAQTRHLVRGQFI